MVQPKPSKSTFYSLINVHAVYSVQTANSSTRLIYMCRGEDLTCFFVCFFLRFAWFFVCYDVFLENVDLFRPKKKRRKNKIPVVKPREGQVEHVC